MSLVIFDGNTAVADPEILAHVESVLAEQAQEALDERYYSLLAEGAGRYTAARQVGMSPVSVRRRMEMDDRFAERVLIAEAESMEPVVEVLRQQALSGDEKSGVKAAIKLLESKSPEEFGQKPQQLNISVGAVQSFDDLNPIDRRIKMLEAELIQKRELTTGTSEDTSE